MIIGPDFIWQHFPKCAGSSMEKALHSVFGDAPDVYFDPVGKGVPQIWHDSIKDRASRDLKFSTDGRKVMACIRRLPDWILSRVHFEARRTAQIPTREMIVSGRFYEAGGTYVNHADYYAKKYSAGVDVWLRTEHLAEDTAKAFDIPLSRVNHHLKHVNRSNHMDRLTDEEQAALYAACPAWAELEAQVYGDIIAAPITPLRAAADLR